jgi:multiple sugar transport system substrate-binding protein
VEAEAKAPLRVAVVDDPALGQAIVRQWQAHSQRAVELREITSERALGEPVEADVMVFPSGLLGELAVQRQIIPWPSTAREPGRAGADLSPAENDYNWSDVFPWLRRRELRWGDELYGVSFGSPQLLLLYRSDLFAQWQLTPPATWQEYERVRAAIADRIAASPSSAASPRYAALEPLSDRWAARCFLARAAAYVQHPNQYSTLFQFTTMEPLIDGPPFVRALEELVAGSGQLPEDVRSLDPAAALARLLAGDIVMAITSPMGAGDAGLPVASDATFDVQPLPGTREVYLMSAGDWQPTSDDSLQRVPLLGIGGRIGAVTRRANSAESARDFLLWLTSPEESLNFARSSPATTLFRLSHAAQPQLWVEPSLAPIAGQYVEAMISNQQQPSALMMLRIPGADRYLESLDRAVRAAVAGQASPKDALAEVAQHWRQLTEQLGRDRQRHAYEASLGLNFSTPLTP